MAATNIKYTIRVNVPVANIYRDDSKNSDTIVATTYQGYELIATKVSDDKQFYYIPAYEGWIQLSNFSITNVNTAPEVSDVFIKGVTKTTDASKEFAGKQNRVVNISDPTTLSSMTISDLIVSPGYTSGAGPLATGNADSTSGIFGIPYQFMANVDRRFKAANRNGVGDGIGRKFGEKILARNNLVYFQPGESQFMPGCTEEEKESVLGALVEGGGGVDVLKSNARYYSFKLDYDDYFKYVNTACHGVASLMDLSGQQITVGGHTSTVGNFQWQNALNNTLAKTVFGTGKNLIFYMDGYNQVSEDYGNSTRESSLVSTVNGYSDTVKEINYIMGYTGQNSEFFNDVSEGYEETFSSIKEGIAEFGSGKGVLHALLGNATTVLSGGKLVFPEMWSDSDYDRTYNIDIKLRSPEADDLSIYLNIIVPYIHLVALTAPRDFDIDGNGNGYKAPFLVRAFVRSMFNIDLGIITSLSVTKGGEGNWAAATNLPTAIDVSLSIKDLYKSMYISNGDNPARLVANDAEMEQLMTVSGVDYYDLDVLDKASLAGSLLTGNIVGLPTRLKTHITDYLNNALGPLYRGRFR